ncbi:branched-chain alpha-keto acid dehydrogenase subunit E2 [Pseudomonas aeruginosa VRFPA09]|nr:branched-chain alpha-keto acid dehydrogenase subunit E2 [Pseudomonas aeruginosa VRFPA09]
MGTHVIKMPDIGEGIAEVELVEWHVQVGDSVNEDQVLAEVMTDKATVEIPSPVAGRILALGGQPGQVMAVGGELIRLEVEGAGNLAESPASPAVRQRARDLGIELQFVQGSGPAGRVLHEDLDAYLTQDGSVTRSGGAAQGYAERHDEQAVPVIGLRRKIAQKMQDAKRRIPHFSYVEEIDVTDLEALRAHLNQKWGGQRGKLTLLPFLVRAMVVALRDFPQLNARYDDEAEVVTRYGAVHVGIATQSDNGLMVPVLRHAESRDLWGNASEVARLAEAARSGKAQRQELSGSTITLSSLGALGGIVSTPVINHPEVAIVGVNRIVERPMVVGGNIVVRKMMNLSSSFDHRVVDGMDAAAFIQAVRGLLEHPATLFLE